MGKHINRMVNTVTVLILVGCDLILCYFVLYCGDLYVEDFCPYAYKLE